VRRRWSQLIECDMQALQGDGEIAGHTCDVSGAVTLRL